MRNGIYQNFVRFCHRFVNKGRKSPNKINANFLSNLVQNFCIRRIIINFWACRNQRNWCYRNSVINYRHSINFLGKFCGFDEIFSFFHHLVINFLTRFFVITICTIKKRYAHGYGSNIKVFLVEHFYSFNNLLCIHIKSLPSYQKDLRFEVLVQDQFLRPILSNHPLFFQKIRLH